MGGGACHLGIQIGDLAFFRVFLIQERSVENVWYFSLGLVLAQFWIPVWMIPIRLQAVKS